MIALLLRLAAPMQSWGTQSRFSERDTQLEPSKSGVIGILAAALGRPREADLSDLAALEMAVRVDREGVKLKDFHTIGGGTPPDWFCLLHGMKRKRDGTFSFGVSRANDGTPDAALSNRYFLADARFLVALGADDESRRPFLESLAGALRAPVHPLFLGRKSFVPTEPILHDPGNPLRQGPSLDVILADEPWQPEDPLVERPSWWRWEKESDEGRRLRLVLESQDSTDGFPRPDVPLSFEKRKRRFDARHVRVDSTEKPVQQWRDRQDTQKEATS